jgi:hypothetical protein
MYANTSLDQYTGAYIHVSGAGNECRSKYRREPVKTGAIPVYSTICVSLYYTGSVNQHRNNNYVSTCT